MTPHDAPPDLPPPVQMMQMLWGFQLSQALYVVAKLGVADELSSGPRAAVDVARAVDADPLVVTRLLRTLASTGVFTEVSQGTFALTPLGETLRSDVPFSMRDIALTWMETHYGPFGDLLHTAKTTQPAATHHYGMPMFEWLAQNPEHAAQFTKAMANVTSGIRMGALPAIALDGIDTLVDVGGADGTILSILAEQNPTLKGVVFDLPHIASSADVLISERGLTDRLRAEGGDFFSAVCAGDGYLLSQVLHDWSDAECAAILTNIHRAGGEGAKLRVLELVMPPGDVPHMSKMLDLTMLGMLPGRERTADEWQTLLESASFRLDAIVDTPTDLSVIEGTAM